MIVELNRADDASLFGAKAAQLAIAAQAELPVPAGLVISWKALEAFARGDDDILSRLSSRLDLEKGLAVRSSASDEDSAIASFAGQYATVLGVRTHQGMVDALHEVHQSARSDAQHAYRRRLGLSEPFKMAAIVQKLVHADVAGVLFTQDPISGEDVRLVESSWGLGLSVVAGLVVPDRFRLERGGRVLESVSGHKDLALRCPVGEEGTREYTVPSELVAKTSLRDEHLAALEALATRCESVFDGTHDLEFAVEDDVLHLLQRRPLTARAATNQR